jgi:hypothetical protein
MDTKEVPPNDPNAKAGYTFDPYSDPSQLVDYWSPNIPFHNSRQRHVGEVAFYTGVKSLSIREIPNCPPLWQDVGHYWDMCTLAGYFAYEFGSKDQLVIKIGTIVGSVGLFEIAKKFVPALTGVVI